MKVGDVCLFCGVEVDEIDMQVWFLCYVKSFDAI